MTYQIVTVNVSQEVGAVPSTLQKTGALVSYGSTLMPVGSYELITQQSELEALVNFDIGGLVADATGLHLLLPTGETIPAIYPVGTVMTITIRGALPVEFNGLWAMDVVNDNSFISTSVPTFQGTATIPGTMTINPDDELIAQGRTFFAQGDSQAVYVLELGPLADGPHALEAAVTALRHYIEDPELRFYTYLMPSIFDKDPSFIQLGRDYSANTAMLYFFIKTAQKDANVYKSIKSICSMANASDAEYDIAALMWQYLSPSPSDMNKVPPMAFRYLIGVTPQPGKGSVLKKLANSFINYVGTGAEGGISNTLVVKGQFSDGNDMTYWYSVDWVQINIHLGLANTIINGSNDPVNPLYYLQDGIDRLQNSAQGEVDSGVTYGLVNGNPRVKAVPFKTYLKNNPNDYAIGRYDGLSLRYTPMRGFTDVVFNIVVTMQLS